MTMHEQAFITDFILFAKDSMSWCARESEGETTQINQVIMTIMDDIKRRSSMSEKTLKALQDAKREIEGLLSNKEASMKGVIDSLKQLSTNSQETDELLDPIVQALQFQDQVRQNLENISKVLSCWMAIRETGISPLEFGSHLLKCTTAMQERDIIRSHISGLPVEEKTEGSIFF